MSELTLCNYCELKKLYNSFPKEEITLKASEHSNGWIAVYVNDKPIGIEFLALTVVCAC